MSRVRYRSCETTSAWRSIAMAELLRTIVVMGMPQRTAVSKSSPVMPNAASPMKFTQNLSGAASLAPMIRPSPVPSAWDLPQPM